MFHHTLRQCAVQKTTHTLSTFTRPTLTSTRRSFLPPTLNKRTFTSSTTSSQTTTTTTTSASDAVKNTTTTTPPTPLQSNEIDPTTIKTWKNPVVFTMDMLAAGTVAYFAKQAYDFTFDQPEIVDQMFNQAQQSPFLIENLGTPMKRSWFWWGSADPYSARVEFDISGPNGSGRIEGKAFKLRENHWEMIYLYGALPQFENRLTDLLPVDEDNVNLMPYIPDPTDPSAAHALTGAPALPYTTTNGQAPEPHQLLPNPAYNNNNTNNNTATNNNNNDTNNESDTESNIYRPFEKGENYKEWVIERASNDDDEIDEDDKFVQQLLKPRNRAAENQIASEITQQHLKELEEYNNLTVMPKDNV